MTGRSMIFRGYGAWVRVDVPEGMDIVALATFVAPELTMVEDSHGPADLMVTRWNGVYHVILGERRYGPYRTEENALRGISNGIHFLLGKRSPMTFVHAGAIELGGTAVIFPGRSRWGKSTMVASLVDQGCGFLSDEYAVVSPEGSVFPFSKPIRLRYDGTALYKHPRGVSAPGGLTCSAVVLTRYEEGSAWRPEPLSRGNAVLGILPNALQSREAPNQVLESLTALVRDAICCESVRGDGEPTIESLRALGAFAMLRRGLQA